MHLLQKFHGLWLTHHSPFYLPFNLCAWKHPLDALEYNFTSKPLIKFKFLHKNDPPPPPESLDLARTLIRDFSNERILDRLLMYERRTEHSLYRTMLELQKLRLIRNMHNLETENDKLTD